MHLGRKYTFRQFVGWTRWEAAWLIGWSLIVTLFLATTQWHFLTVPAPVLTIVGAALAIIVGFKNQQCYARYNEALALAGQLSTNSLILANRLKALIGEPDAARPGSKVEELFYRHLAWLTALRFFLREPKPWENAAERANVRFLAGFAAPESASSLKDELKKYLPEADVEKIISYGGDKVDLIMRMQYAAIGNLNHKSIISEYAFFMLIFTLDDLLKLQGGLKKIKNFPYARNFYSIAVFLIAIFAIIVPFGLYPYAYELGESVGLGHWTVWLNVPFSALVGWIFVSLEKIGENSSNPFEGGSNDVPISAIVRRIEIEVRNMLGEDASLKPLEAKGNILF